MSEQRKTVAQTTYVISVAAQLAGMHPQTLRQYDRLGIVIPRRTKGRGRRYTSGDIRRLREVQRLSQQEGINLAGIRRILDLEEDLHELRRSRDELAERVEEFHMRANRVFAAASSGEVDPIQRGQRPSVPIDERELVLGGPLRLRALPGPENEDGDGELIEDVEWEDE